MRRAFEGFRRRKPLLAFGIALDTLLVSLLMSGLGAAPVAAATPAGTVYNTTTQTSWIPLQCNLNGSLTTGIPVHIGVALRATFPTTVVPGQKFPLANVPAYQLQPGAAQFASLSLGAANGVSGAVTEFANKLTNATGSFNPGAQAPYSPTVVNSIQAMQPPNTDTPNPVDPLINPTTGNPAPGQWWTDLGVGDTAERHNVFSFGMIPIDNSSANVPTAYGPTPGTGGGTNPNLALDGVADPINIWPFTATGSLGQNVVLDTGDSARQVITTDGQGDFYAMAYAFFRSKATGKYITTGTSSPHGFPTPCGKDATASAVPPAAPGFCTSPGVPAG